MADFAVMNYETKLEGKAMGDCDQEECKAILWRNLCQSRPPEYLSFAIAQKISQA